VTAFVPQLDEGDLVIQTERSPNISLESAALEATAMEQVLLEIPEVRAAVSRIGSPAVATDIMGIEQADVFVELAPHAMWRPGLDRDALVAEMQALLAARAPAQALVFTQPIQMRFNELLGGVGDGRVAQHLRRGPARAARAGGGGGGGDRAAGGGGDVRIMAPPDAALVEIHRGCWTRRRTG
jgi:cobalt-zinc-cadmium resistance protein CzcA